MPFLSIRLTLRACWLAAAVALAATPPARAQVTSTLTVLHDFATANDQNVNSDGDYPSTNLLRASDGNLYGSTASGGPSGAGTIFRLTPAGKFDVLHAFNGGSEGGAASTLIEGGDGFFYGTTSSAGGASVKGTVFKMAADGTVTVLHTFTGADGANPMFGLSHPTAALVHTADGFFYGTTLGGGAHGYGTVFKITATGTLTTLHSFNKGVDGSYPFDALIQAADGNFYGTTSDVYTGYYGTVFRITPGGTLATLLTFDGSDGSDPVAGLVQGTDGNFYGTTAAADGSGESTVFQLTPAGGLTVLYDFDSHNVGDGAFGTLIRASDGLFYGTNYEGNLVFAITPTGQFTTVHRFAGAEGAGPFGGLIQDASGAFYGTTSQGGSNGTGTVYKLVVTPPPPSVQFPVAAYHVGENAGMLAVSVTRTGGSAGAVTVNYATGNGTGSAGTDYRATAGTLSWASGDTTPKTIPVTILDRGVNDGSTHTFTVNLGAPTGGVTVGSFAHTSVNIVDTDPPVVTSATTDTATTGAAYSYQITATNDPVNFGVQGLPGGLGINASTGVISGVPNAAGKFTLTLNAYNAAGKGSATLTLTVKLAPPVITSGASAGGTVGRAFSYQITATSTPTGFGVQGLPGGLSVNSTTGVLSGTPKVAGKFTLTLNAYNAAGKGSATLMLTVAQ